MIRPEIKQIFEGINATPYGKALQEFLDNELNELDRASSCKNWEDTLARAHAVKIIEKLFSLMNIKKTEVKNRTLYT